MQMSRLYIASSTVPQPALVWIKIVVQPLTRLIWRPLIGAVSSDSAAIGSETSAQRPEGLPCTYKLSFTIKTQTLLRPGVPPVPGVQFQGSRRRTYIGSVCIESLPYNSFIRLGSFGQVGKLIWLASLLIWVPRVLGMSTQCHQMGLSVFLMAGVIGGV